MLIEPQTAIVQDAEEISLQSEGTTSKSKIKQDNPYGCSKAS
jgi:hypothetical protein